MPNHITTILRADPDVIQGFLREEDGKFSVDFEMVVPSPPNKEEDGCSGTHDPGVVCWYSWNIENWGTKWNAYSTEYDPARPGEVQFETAWSHPLPVIEALSKKFPDKGLMLMYADEDFGANVDAYSIMDGYIHDRAGFSNFSDEALELASQVIYKIPYLELKEQQDQEQLQSAREYTFAKRIFEESPEDFENVWKAWNHIKTEKLEIPADIIDLIGSVEEANEIM